VIVSPGPVLQAPVRELKRAISAVTSVVTLATAEREAIVRALRDAGGRVGGDEGAAAKLGMKRTTLQAKMRKLGIGTKNF
jgi:formate hydrogenlyase transcriptional activator